MLVYRFLFSWLFSAILNCFSPMVADESMLNAERSPTANLEQAGYEDDPKKHRKTNQ